MSSFFKTISTISRNICRAFYIRQRLSALFSPRPYFCESGSGVRSCPRDPEINVFFDIYHFSKTSSYNFNNSLHSLHTYTGCVLFTQIFCLWIRGSLVEKFSNLLKKNDFCLSQFPQNLSMKNVTNFIHSKRSLPVFFTENL